MPGDSAATGAMDAGEYLTDATATVAAGAAIAATLKPGDVIALCGPMGAGKTHLTRGLCEALGCRDSVSSPTFGLVHEYHGGLCPVFHFDFHRLRSAQEALALGWDDYLDAGGIAIIEWADLFPELLPATAQWWGLTPDGAGRRLRLLPN